MCVVCASSQWAENHQSLSYDVDGARNRHWPRSGAWCFLTITATATNKSVLWSFVALRLTEEPASIIQPGWSLCRRDRLGRGPNPRFDHRVASSEDRMRKVTITIAALALVALTASFAPHPWSASPQG
jgi:hypothetical protein